MRNERHIGENWKKEFLVGALVCLTDSYSNRSLDNDVAPVAASLVAIDGSGAVVNGYPVAGHRSACIFNKIINVDNAGGGNSRGQQLIENAPAA